MTTTTKTKTAQATNGGVATALAVILAFAAGEAGLEVPAEIVAAVGTVIGWAFARFGV
tara:strand:+ start:926 stop:1099 length:174 start_codon:yes stop_codon:yes gene_type:complete